MTAFVHHKAAYCNRYNANINDTTQRMFLQSNNTLLQQRTCMLLVISFLSHFASLSVSFTFTAFPLISLMQFMYIIIISTLLNFFSF